MIAYPKAWTPGTNGLVEADVVTAVINNDQDFEKFRGQLHGKYVMTTTMREVPADAHDAMRSNDTRRGRMLGRREGKKR